MSQRTVLAAVAGAVTLFVLGYLFYGLLLADFFAANGVESLEQPVLWIIFLGELVSAILLTYIFSQWATISTFAGGAKAGALIGALMALGFGLVQVGAMGSMNLTAVLADTLVSAVRVAIAGGVIGAMLGRG